jgi:hypothetical protein
MFAIMHFKCSFARIKRLSRLLSTGALAAKLSSPIAGSGPVTCVDQEL